MLTMAYFNGLREVNHVYTNGFGGKPVQINDWQLIADCLKESSNSIMFILTDEQWERWESIKKKYDLSKYVVYDMEKFVTNRNYPDKGRRLRAFVLKGQGTNEN